MWKIYIVLSMCIILLGCDGEQLSESAAVPSSEDTTRIVNAFFKRQNLQVSIWDVEDIDVLRIRDIDEGEESSTVLRFKDGKFQAMQSEQIHLFLEDVSLYFNYYVSTHIDTIYPDSSSAIIRSNPSGITLDYNNASGIGLVKKYQNGEVTDSIQLRHVHYRPKALN